MKQHHDIKPLRIVFSVFLAIISVVFFSSFVYLSTIRAALSKDLFTDVFSNVDLFDAKLGILANEMSIDANGVNEDSTVAEAMAIIISDTAKEEFNYDISQEAVEEILDDPKLREDLSNVTGDLMGGVIYGDLDSDQLADDVEDLIVDNKDKIEEIGGYKISDDVIDDIHDTIADLDTNGGIVNSNPYGYNDLYINDFVKDSVVYFFLGGGILCVIGIMLLNMFKLPTGFRTNGIAFLINGIFTLIVGFIVRFSTGLLLTAVNTILVSEGSPTISGVVNDVFDSFAANIAKHILIPGAIFFVLGVACMITQGVLLSVQKKKVK